MLIVHFTRCFNINPNPIWSRCYRKQMVYLTIKTGTSCQLMVCFTEISPRFDEIIEHNNINLNLNKECKHTENDHRILPNLFHNLITHSFLLKQNTFHILDFYVQDLRLATQPIFNTFFFSAWENPFPSASKRASSTRNSFSLDVLRSLTQI